ncbi:MAG: transposase [Ruminococcus sp.]|nr:transposase [Ruminococcus sp.]
MKNRKCPSCGGEMELSFSDKCLVCPFCGTHIDAEITDDGNGALLDTKMFDILWDIKALKQYENVMTCLDSFCYCVNSLKNADSVAKYIRTALINEEDVASEGINQHRLDKIMPKISELLDTDEHIIVYGDDGLFARGKCFFVVTDRRSIFIDGKKKCSLLHSDVTALRLAPNGGYPRWKVNNQDGQYISGIGAKYRLQGAVAALICLYARQHSSEKIKLM